MKLEFASNFSVIDEKDLSKWNLSKASMLNTASHLFSNANRDNFDILPVLFSVAVVNQFNLNDDAIETIDAAKMLPDFANKPINIEHNKNFIVGHLIKASFSNSDPDLYENDILDFVYRKDKFYISAAGFIYKSVFPELAEVIMNASNPEHESYQAYSASWEISFEDYDISVGNSDLISECSVLNREKDSLSFSSYEPNLKANGGNGLLSDGRKVKRIIRGRKIPIGVGLTENPAARVKGIYSLASITNKISENKKTNVTQEKISTINSNTMDEKQFKELTDLVAKASASTSDEAFKRIETLLKEEGQNWQSKTDKATKDLAEATANIEKLKEDAEAFKATAEDLKKDNEQLKQSLAEKEASDTFNLRMNSLAGEFNLSEEEEKIVALEVKDIPLTAEAFDKYLNKARVIFNHRKKTAVTPTVSAVASIVVSEPTSLEVDKTDKKVILNNNGGAGEKLDLFQRLQKVGLEIEK